MFLCFSGGQRLFSVTIHWNEPLTLPLSPSDGERESLSQLREQSPFGDRTQRVPVFSLSPSDGERVGVRGLFDCIVTV